MRRRPNQQRGKIDARTLHWRSHRDCDRWPGRLLLSSLAQEKRRATGFDRTGRCRRWTLKRRLSLTSILSCARKWHRAAFQNESWDNERGRNLRRCHHGENHSLLRSDKLMAGNGRPNVYQTNLRRFSVEKVDTSRGQAAHRGPMLNARDAPPWPSLCRPNFADRATIMTVQLGRLTCHSNRTN